MSDGSGDGESSPVDEELCGSLELAVDGDKQIVLTEACNLPCPGSKSAPNEVVFIQLPAPHERAYKVTQTAAGRAEAVGVFTQTLNMSNLSEAENEIVKVVESC